MTNIIKLFTEQSEMNALPAERPDEICMKLIFARFELCGPVYAFRCRHADEQRAARSRPFRDQCESAWWTISSRIRRKRSTVKKNISGEHFEFRGQSIIQYISYHICVMFALNKMFNFWYRSFYLCY